MKTEFSIHPSFVLMWAILIVFNKDQYALYVFISAAIHECAHITAFLQYGAKLEYIRILPFGIDVKLKSVTDISLSKEIVSSLAGIFANIVFSLSLYSLRNVLKAEGVLFLSLCNLCLAFINMIPIIPLDGGRALYFFLLKHLPQPDAVKFVRIVSIIFIVPLFVCGAYVLYVTHYNFSLLLICLYLSLYLFIKKEV